MRFVIVLILTLACAGYVDAEEASYYIGSRSGSDLLDQPDSQASVVKHLEWKTYVNILTSKRNWRKIQTLDKSKDMGWLPEGALRKRYSSSSTSSASSSFFSGFTSMFRSPEPERQTAVLGVRGLEEGGVARSGQPSTEQAKQMVEWMDTLTVPDRDVARFVENGNLNP